MTKLLLSFQAYQSFDSYSIKDLFHYGQFSQDSPHLKPIKTSEALSVLSNWKKLSPPYSIKPDFHKPRDVSPPYSIRQDLSSAK